MLLSTISTFVGVNATTSTGNVSSSQVVNSQSTTINVTSQMTTQTGSTSSHPLSFTGSGSSRGIGGEKHQIHQPKRTISAPGFNGIISLSSNALSRSGSGNAGHTNLNNSTSVNPILNSGIQLISAGNLFKNKFCFNI